MGGDWRTMEARANRVFSARTINDVPTELFAPGGDLVQAAFDLHIATSDLHRTYLDAIPAPLRETLREAIHQALTADPRLPVSLWWASGPHWSLEISTSDGSDHLVLLLRGPNPPEEDQARGASSP